MNKKTIIAIIALVAAAALLLGVYFLTRPEVSEGSKTITVTVIHSDGKEQVFTYQTDHQYLGALLKEKGLIEGENGLYTVVDGETALWNDEVQAYWNFLIGDEYAMEGMDTTVISDGDHFKLVYTLG